MASEPGQILKILSAIMRVSQIATAILHRWYAMSQTVCVELIVGIWVRHVLGSRYRTTWPYEDTYLPNILHLLHSQIFELTSAKPSCTISVGHPRQLQQDRSTESPICSTRFDQLRYLLHIRISLLPMRCTCLITWSCSPCHSLLSMLTVKHSLRAVPTCSTFHLWLRKECQIIL